MARPRSITVDDVRSAVAQLRDAGRHPGLVAVRSITGGSVDTVRDLLRQVLAAEEPAPAPEQNVEIVEETGIPPGIMPTVEALVATWRGLVETERRRADEAIASAQRSADLRATAAEDRLRQVVADLAATEAELVDTARDRDELAKKLEKATKAAAKAAAKVEAMQMDLEDYPGVRRQPSTSHDDSGPWVIRGAVKDARSVETDTFTDSD